VTTPVQGTRGTTITIDNLIRDNGRTGSGRDPLAKEIADKWTLWKTARNGQEEMSNEVHSYVFATDTRTTSNKKLPWANSTTTPKLCQIRDNLHANYMAALFPNDNWFDWEPFDRESADADKARIVRSYMQVKMERSNARSVISQLVYDYIDYGNAFGTVEFTNTQFEPPDDPSDTAQPFNVQGYVGPRIVRISPLDIVFNLRANSFMESPKIVRSVVTVGDLKERMRKVPGEEARWADTLNRILELYTEVSAYKNEDGLKNVRFADDGFGSVWQYMERSEVEVLEFYGSIYDAHTKTILHDRMITVVNRSYVIQDVAYKDLTGGDPFVHVGWRSRPDNLWGMGPLDNLVGLQYRIDHLENLKADVFDKIAHPKPFLRGETSEWTDAPGEPIYGEENSAVAYLAPDATALNADFQIDTLERRMEEMAGAPKQAMGIRTPGEKTAYEVQTLENAAGRIFQNKVQHFESQFLEPLLNLMFASALSTQWQTDKIAVRDRVRNFTEFMSIDKDDIVARGVIRPRGARHFAAKAMLVQNLNQLFASPLGQDAGVRVHFSGKKLANMLQEALNVEDYSIFGDNIQVVETSETQKLMQAAEEEVMSEGMADPDMGVEEMPLE
jgi:hypothetical protein